MLSPGMLPSKDLKKTSMVAFFTGTHDTYRGKITDDAKTDGDVFSDSTQRDVSDPYINFGFLSGAIDDNLTIIKGFDGCQEDRSGIFAFGITKPANSCFNLVKEKVNALQKINALPSPKKFTLVLEAYSRGALSALALAKQIQNSELKDHVDIILNLRDPVPGNLNIAAKMDKAQLTVAKQYYDLTDCTCIKEAHITVFQEGNRLSDKLLPGFDVLIPKFAKSTTVKIEMLPGSHMILEQPPHVIKYETNQVYQANPLIHQLSLLKSLQIYIENNIEINFEEVKRKLEVINNSIEDDKELKEKLKFYLVLVKNNFKNNPINNNKLHLILLKVQLFIYEKLLTEFNDKPSKFSPVRKIHFNKKVMGVTTFVPNQAHYLNERHADLEKTFKEKTSKIKIPSNITKKYITYFGFKKRAKWKRIHSIESLNTCSFFSCNSEDELPDFASLKENCVANAVYVICNQKLFYYDKEFKRRIDIKLTTENLEKLKKVVYVEQEPQTKDVDKPLVKDIDSHKQNLKMFINQRFQRSAALPTNLSPTLPKQNSTTTAKESSFTNLSKDQLDKMIEITGHKPIDLFQQCYNRIMFVLEELIKSNCTIPPHSRLYCKAIENEVAKKDKKEKVKYIDYLKKTLTNIANNDKQTDLQKFIELERQVLTVYRDIRVYEGFFNSRLRIALEPIIEESSFLGFKSRYGFSFNAINESILQRRIGCLAHLMGEKSRETAENDPLLYKKVVKLLLRLNDVKPDLFNVKIQHNDEKSDHKSKSNNDEQNLVNELKNILTSNKTMTDFKNCVVFYHGKIQEKRTHRCTIFACSSEVESCLEKFIKNELELPAVLLNHTLTSCHTGI